MHVTQKMRACPINEETGIRVVPRNIYAPSLLYVGMELLGSKRKSLKNQ